MAEISGGKLKPGRSAATNRSNIGIYLAKRLTLLLAGSHD